MGNRRGNQIAMKQFAVNQFKREYNRRDCTEEKLKEIRDNLDSYIPDSYHQAREHELRIQAINELLKNDS